MHTATHRPTLLAATCAALLLASAAQAQVYRVVGPDGRVSYSDKPQPAATVQAPSGAAATRGAGTAGNLPYALAQTAQRFPVTLYTGQDCNPCENGRNLLQSRGIPFIEKTVNTNEDIVALQKISGTSELPLLTIGSQRISGFDSRDWNQYLDAAGYPKTSQLPGTYKRPAAAPLAPPSAAPAAAAAAPAPAVIESTQTAPTQGPSIAPERSSTNPAGIRF